jgi:hypothetical protein
VVPRSPLAAGVDGSEGRPIPASPEPSITSDDVSAGGAAGPTDTSDPLHPAADTDAQPLAASPWGASLAQGDWLASVCPYLASDDGTYRSAAPAEGHRCTAQDPPATLPLAFQERFCLTDRHPRCEMYKFAQETDSTGGIPVARIPPTDPPTPRIGRRSDGSGPGRSVILTAVGIGAVIVLLLLLALALDSCSGDGGSGGDPDASQGPQTTEAPAVTPRPTPTPTPAAEASPTPDPDSDPNATPPAEIPTVTILYEIQPDEALLKVAETFGVSRNLLRKVNPGLADLRPAELPGTVIEIPISGDMTLEAAAELPGYQGIAP